MRMWAFFDFFRNGIAACEQRNVARAFTDIIRSKRLAGVASVGVRLMALALFTRMSRPPNSLAVRLIASATAAVEVHFPPAILKASRTAAIMADAAHVILTSDARANTGQFYIDEDVLKKAGVKDFDRYAVTPGVPLFKDLFLD